MGVPSDQMTVEGSANASGGVPPGGQGPGAFLAPGGDEQRPAGTVDDFIKGAQMDDPFNTEEVTAEEQAQYDDFVDRAILLISDPRRPEDGSPSPSEATLKMMNNPSLSVGQALGLATAETVALIHNAAKRQGMEYSADVLFHGADELISALYVLGTEARIFPNAPKPTLGGEGETDDDGESITGAYNFSDEAMEIMAEAKFEAARVFGEKMMETGQISEEMNAEAQQFWKAQIEREMNSGEVGDEILDGVDVDAWRNGVAKNEMGGA